MSNPYYEEWKKGATFSKKFESVINLSLQYLEIIRGWIMEKKHGSILWMHRLRLGFKIGQNRRRKTKWSKDEDQKLVYSW